MRSKYLRAAALAAALLILFGVSSMCYAGSLCWPVYEPFYNDIESYRDKYGSTCFEYQTVLPLWQAHIVAGYLYESWYSGSYAYFNPYDNATRLWYGQCLMEPYGGITDMTVRVPGTDVYWWSYNYYGTHYVRWFAPYANKMAEKGLISWTSTFVDGYIRRDEGFSWAIRAAGLGPVAQSMSDSEASYWLGKFPDGWSTDPQYRKDVALAIKLNIARGTDDGRLHPSDYLARVHAAAIILRTASITLSVPSSVIVPGGTASISASHVGFGTPRSYTLRIVSYTGSSYYKSTVRTFSGSGLPSGVIWDGKDSYGNYVAQGQYFVELDVQYTVNGMTSTYSAVPRPIQVIKDNRYLSVQMYNTLADVPDVGYVYFSPYWYSETTPTLDLWYDGTHIASYTGSPGQWRYAPVPSSPGWHTVKFSAYLYQSNIGSGYFYVTTSVYVDQTSVSVSTDKSTFMAGQLLQINVVPSPSGPTWGRYYTPKVSVIRLSDNTVVRTLTGMSLTWDGKDASGQYCPSGTYRLQAEVTFAEYAPVGTQPQWTRTAYKDVTFISWEIKDVQVTGITSAPPGNPSLPTSTLPVLVTPSSQVTVQCSTSGPGQSVKFRVGSQVYDGTPQNARGSMTNTWTAVVSPGTSQNGATVSMTIELYDSSGKLQKTYGPVTLLVVDARSVSASSSASISGTYAVSGGKAYILIDVVGTPVSGPTVSGFGQDVTAAWDSNRGKYVAVLNVPAGTGDGTYTVSVSAVVSLSGWPDRTLTASVSVPVKQERLSLTLSTQRFAPRLGTPLEIDLSLRPVTTPVSCVLVVKSPGGSIMYTEWHSGLPPAVYWDGKDSGGSYCDSGGYYTVTVTATCTHDPGGGFPVDTVQVSGSATVQLPNLRETENSPGHVIIIE